jgi:hypothetical protein
MAIGRTADERRTIRAVIEWLRMRGEADSHYAAPWLQQLIPDAGHSALLLRLLEGKRPLPQSPPLAYAYPWYELIDEGEAIVENFHVAWQPAENEQAPAADLPPDTRAVRIRQSWWRVDERLSDDEFIVTYQRGWPTCRLTRTTHAEDRQQASHGWEAQPRPAWRLTVMPAES